MLNLVIFLQNIALMVAHFSGWGAFLSVQCVTKKNGLLSYCQGFLCIVLHYRDQMSDMKKNIEYV